MRHATDQESVMRVFSDTFFEAQMRIQSPPRGNYADCIHDNCEGGMLTSLIVCAPTHQRLCAVLEESGALSMNGHGRLVRVLFHDMAPERVRYS